MRTNHRLTLIALLIVALQQAVALAQNSSLTNGSFELAAIPTNTYPSLTNGSTLLPGWNVSVPAGAGVALINGAAAYGFAAADGDQFVAFNGGGATAGGTLSQDVTTAIGQSYRVTFTLGWGGLYDSLALRLEVQDPASGAPDFQEEYVVPPGAGWKPAQTFTWVATRATTRLAFIDISGAAPSTDLLLDNVILNWLPRLSIAAVDTNVVLNWPASGSNYVLQTTTNLSHANWTDFVCTPAVGGGQCVVTNAVGTGDLFYRLHKR